MWQNVRSASAVNSPTSPAVKINISGQSAATGNEIWEMNGHSDSWCWLVWLFGSEVSTFSREYLNTNNLHALLTISVKYYASLVKKGNFIQDKSGMTPPSLQSRIYYPPLTRLSLSVSRSAHMARAHLSLTGPGRSRSRSDTSDTSRLPEPALARVSYLPDTERTTCEHGWRDHLDGNSDIWDKLKK